MEDTASRASDGWRQGVLGLFDVLATLVPFLLMYVVMQMNVGLGKPYILPFVVLFLILLLLYTVRACTTTIKHPKIMLPDISVMCPWVKELNEDGEWVQLLVAHGCEDFYHVRDVDSAGNLAAFLSAHRRIVTSMLRAKIVSSMLCTLAAVLIAVGDNLVTLVEYRSIAWKGKALWVLSLTHPLVECWVTSLWCLGTWRDVNIPGSPSHWWHPFRSPRCKVRCVQRWLITTIVKAFVFSGSVCYALYYFPTDSVPSRAWFFTRLIVGPPLFFLFAVLPLFPAYGYHLGLNRNFEMPECEIVSSMSSESSENNALTGSVSSRLSDSTLDEP